MISVVGTTFKTEYRQIFSGQKATLWYGLCFWIGIVDWLS